MAYNGHPTHAKWNVSLWFSNDEGLYRIAKEFIRRSKTKDEAAERIYEYLKENGVTETPDGTKFSVKLIRYAIRGDF